MKNESQKVSHLLSVADNSTLEIALTQGQANSFSSTDGQWNRQLDLSDQTVYGNALSKLQTAELISENGKLNPKGWLKPSVVIMSATQGGSKTDSFGATTVNTVANATGTYVDGAYQVNDSYGVRAVGVATEKGMTVYACIVDLALRSAEGGTLSFCTGENGSTLETIIQAASESTRLKGSSDSSLSGSSTTIGSSFAGSITISSSSSLRLVFFDTETYDILGSARAKNTLSGTLITSSPSSENNNNSITFVALDKDGNEIEGNLNLGVLLPGEARRVSVLLFNERNSNLVVGDKNDKEYDDKYEYGDESSDDTRELDTDTDMNYADGYKDKYQYEIVTGSSKLEFETGVNMHFVTALQFDISFNLVFTDK